MLSPLERVICATVGASLTVIATTPLDVLKTRVQAAAALRAVPDALINAGGPRSAIQFAVALVRREGVRALWRGLLPSLLMAVPSQALYFLVYDSLRGRLERQGGHASIVAPFVAGVASRTIVVVAMAPLELIRTQAMAFRGVTRVPLLEALRAESRGSGLWRGLIPTLVRDVPFSGIYWLTYESLNKSLKRYFTGISSASSTDAEVTFCQTVCANWATSFMSGFIAGSLAATLTTPFDVIKTRLQLNNMSGGGTTGERANFRATFLNVAKNEGIRGLFSGVGLRVARVGPACAIMISSYETGKRLFAQQKRNHALK